MPTPEDATAHGKVSPLAATVTADSSDAPHIPDLLVRGDTVGRYVVLGQLGEGAMGVVHAAYDQKLDRRVALKVLHRSVDTPRDAGAQTRLVEEAQAMARLSHPNVVTVYDVLVDGDRALVAMELVEGESLRAWLASHSRSWREILAAFVQAGRGLAAAHAAGLIHRDFKPDNVLVGTDGRVRVGDFGLALASPSLAPRPLTPEESLGERGSGRLSTASTAVAFAGSPAYMAPEQLRGASADERSDQFSYCVALYEALHGAPPFEGTDLGSLVDSIERQRFRAPARDPGPRWVRAALARGLRSRAQDRYASLAELLAALEADPGPKRARYAVAGIVSLCAAGVAATVLHTRRVEALECVVAGDRIDAVWNDEARHAVQESFAATKRAYAGDTFVRAAGVLDAYSARWRAESVATCEQLRQRSRDPLAAERSTCMGERLSELRAFVDVLKEADPETVNRAVGGARALVGIDVCEGRDPLRGKTWPSDPTVRDEAQALTEQIAIAGALRNAGRYREGLTVAEKNAAEAERIGFQPLLADAVEKLGESQRYAGDVQGAEKSAKRAILAAERTGSARVAVRSWALLAGRQAERRDTPLALESLDHADAWLERVGDDDLFRAQAWLQRALILTDDAQYDAGRALAEKARAVFEHHEGADLSEAWNALGIDDDMQSKYESARANYQRVIDWRTNVLGPDHPEVAIALANLGEMLGDQGHYDEAIGDLKRALAIDEQANGPVHPATLETEYGLAHTYILAGRPADALPLAEQALEGARTTFGPGSKDELNALGALCRALLGVHRPADAIEPAERELAMRLADASDDDFPNARTDLGLALTLSGKDPKRGRALLRQARGELEKKGEPDRFAEIDAVLGSEAGK